MPGFTISLAELVYFVSCLRCGETFYLKVEPEDGIPSDTEILLSIDDWSCDDHPLKGRLAELHSIRPLG